MADLTVSTLDATGTARPRSTVVAFPCDETGTRIVAHTSSGAIVDDVTAATDDTGTVVLDLVPRDPPEERMAGRASAVTPTPVTHRARSTL